MSESDPQGALAFSEQLSIDVDGRRVVVPQGTEVKALVEDPPEATAEPPIAAVYNNRLVSLSYRLRSGGNLRFVRFSDRPGWDVYRRSACLMLYEAMRRCFPSVHIVLHQTHGDGLYYEVQGLRPDEEFGSERCRQLAAEMRAVADADLPFVIRATSVEEARDLLRERHQEQKLFLLRTHWETTVRTVWCGGFVDLFHNPVAYSTGAIQQFTVTPHEGGFLLRLPIRGEERVRGRAKVSRMLFLTHTETRRWNGQIGASNLGQLNSLAVAGDVNALMRVAEAGHEKRIAGIAEEIAQSRRRRRLVLVAGPSASGKTTFVKRLGVQLEVHGLRPVAVSVDDFFVSRDQTPRDEDGEYDFECLEALDLELFNEVLVGLLERGEARVPRYDFHTGTRNAPADWKTLTVDPDQLLLVEGIHGLNPGLTAAVADRHKYRIYISALTQLSIDDHNRIFTSDTRLLRRIVRDRRYRGYPARETIRRWPLVRRGERRNIFPYQDRADVMFNSALVYEHAILKNYVQRYLLEIDERDKTFIEAYRLLGFLRLIVPILPDDVPGNSILREFIGGSAFAY